MKKILAKAYGIYAGLIFFLLSIFMVFAFLAIKYIPMKDRYKMLNVFRVTNFLLAIWQLLTFMRMKTEGWEKLDAHSVYVFAPNHVNLLDIIVFGRFFRFYARPLAKKEITKMPFFGQLFSLTSILVDRENRNSKKESLVAMQTAMQKGMSVIIFPEGTRNRSDLPLREFHTGAFRLAITEQVPIVPIVQLNLRTMQPVGTIELYPGKMLMRILDPVPTTGLTIADVQMLSDKVKDIIEQELRKEDKHWRTQPVASNAIATVSETEG